jgi:hypothetical protein
MAIDSDRMVLERADQTFVWLLRRNEVRGKHDDECAVMIIDDDWTLQYCVNGVSRMHGRMTLR